MFIRNKFLIGFAIVLEAVCLGGCFGPFYTDLITEFKTSEKKEYSAIFHGYEIKILGASYEEGNRKGSDNFSFSMEIYSTEKYKNEPDLDTLDVIKVEPFCVYLYENDSMVCLNYSVDSVYSFFFFKKRVVHEPTYGGYTSTIIPKSNDSIRISFIATAYNDTSYTEMLEKQDFEAVLYRYYHKFIPISR